MNGARVSPPDDSLIYGAPEPAGLAHEYVTGLNDLENLKQ